MSDLSIYHIRMSALVRQNEQLLGHMAPDLEQRRELYENLAEIAECARYMQTGIEVDHDRPLQCAYPECTNNDDERCIKWLIGECPGPKVDCKGEK